MAPSIRTTPSGGLAVDALGPGDGDGAAAASADLVTMQQQQSQQQQASPVLNALTPTSHSVRNIHDIIIVFDSCKKNPSDGPLLVVKRK